MSDSFRPHGLQHARFFCPLLSPGVCSNSCPLSRWCHPTISSSVVPFCPQSFPASGSFPMNQLLVFNSVVHLNSSNNLEFIFIYEKRQRGTFAFLDLVSSFWIHPVFHHVSPPPLPPARPEPSFVSQGSLQGPCSGFSGSTQFDLNQQPEQPFSNVNQTLQLKALQWLSSLLNKSLRPACGAGPAPSPPPLLPLPTPAPCRSLPLVYPDRPSDNSAEIRLLILGSERSKLDNTW